MKGRNNKQNSIGNPLLLGSQHFSSGRKGLKGQAEIIIVLGIVVVAVVGVLFATKTISLLPPEPESVSALKNSLNSDIQRRISSDATQLIRKIAQNGGYLDLDSDPKPPALDYLGNKVVFWQYGNTTITRTRADFEATLSAGLKESLKGIDPKSYQSVKGKDVSIGSPRSVEVKINDNDVQLKIDLPVSVEGYDFGKPIEVKIPSSLGKAINFGNELIEKSQKKELQITGYDEDGEPVNRVSGVEENRLFERFIINSIRAYRESDEFGRPKIPSEGILTGCGTPPIVKTWFSLKPDVEDLIAGTLDNIYTAGKVPKGITNRTSYLPGVLPVFTNLDVKFSLGNELDEKSFQVFQNNGEDPGRVIIRTENFGYTTLCVSPPYRISYFLLFPVVAEVGDEDLKLKFAFHTFVNGYKPGDWKDLGLTLGFFDEEVKRCTVGRCPAKITAVDAAGAVADADVFYSYCPLGKTDSEGVLEALVPCGISQLEITEKDHKLFKEVSSSDSVKDKTIRLARLSLVKIHIFNMEMVERAGVYTVADVRPNSESFTLSIGYGGETAPFFVKTSDQELTTNLIPTLEDVALTTVVQKGDSILGGFDAAGKIPEGTTDLWFYNPVLTEGYPYKPLPNPVDPDDPVEVKNQKAADTENQRVIEENVVASAQIRLKLINVTVECGNQVGVSLPLSFVPVNSTTIKSCVV